MVWKNDHISPRQLTMLLVVNIFGTGVVLLPRTVTHLAGADGWLVVVVSTLLALGCVYLIASVASLYPDKDFYEYTTLITGRPMGLLLTVGLIVRLLLHMGLMLRASLEIIRATMLPTTPLWLLATALLLISGFGASKGYETRARLAELLVIIILVPVLFVFTIAAFHVDYSNLLPLLQATPAQLSRGGMLAMSAFVGIEFVLLAGKYVGGEGTAHPKSSHQVLKASMKAVVFLGLAMVTLVIITTARFGIHQLPFLSWPVIQMMDSTALPGSFVERQGAWVMSFFILSVFAMTNACLFFSSLMCKSVVKQGRHSLYIWLCMGIGLGIALWPQDMNHTQYLLERVYLSFGLAYMFGVPAGLLVIAKLRTKVGQRWVSKKQAKATLMLLLVLTGLTGCDKKELEERGYITALAVDKGDSGQLAVTMLKATGEEQDPPTHLSITANNLQEAIYNLDKRGNETLYFGITHTVVLGESLLADEPLTRGVIDNLARDMDLPKEVFVLSTADDTHQFLVDMPLGNTSATHPKFDRSGYNTLNQLDQTTLEKMLESLYRTGGVSLPKVTLSDDYIDVIGLTLLAAGEPLDTLDAQYLSGYLFLLGEGAGETLAVSYPANQPQGEMVATLHETKRKVHFDTYGGQPRAILELEAQATIDQYLIEGLSVSQIDQAAQAYAQRMETQAITAYANLADSHDSYLGLWELMRKQAPQLYARYHEQNQLQVEVQGSVTIWHTGALR